MGRGILVIEDDERLRGLMRDWLQIVFLASDVLIAPRGGAVPAAAEQDPRVVLIDLDSLEAERWDVLSRLKTAAPDADIVALTVDDHAALRQDVEAAGVMACVRKSDLSDRLIPTLTALLDGSGGAARDQQPKTVVCI